MSHSNLTLNIGIPESWQDLSTGSGCLYRDPASGITLAVELVESLGMEPEAILARQQDAVSELEVDVRLILQTSITCGFGPAAVMIRELCVGSETTRQIVSASVRDGVALVVAASVRGDEFVANRAYLLNVLRTIDVATPAAIERSSGDAAFEAFPNNLVAPKFGGGR